MKKIILLFILFVCAPVYADDSASILPPNPFMELYNRAVELEQKYLAAKEREQSLANRMLGGATMALTGIGGMELAQGLAEQKADKDAELDMDAYLATFKCEYGNNRAKGSETSVELPGANNLFDLYQEYMTLAADLKERKEALGLKPGIESEVVLDKANTGLYDDTSTGITNGTYASLYRAKMGSEADQAKLQEMADTSKKRVVGGTIAASAGMVMGTIGNLLINGKKHTEEINQLVQEACSDNKCTSQSLSKTSDENLYGDTLAKLAQAALLIQNDRKLDQQNLTNIGK